MKREKAAGGVGMTRDRFWPVLGAFCAVSLLSLGLYAVFTSRRELIRKAAEGFSRPLRRVLGTVSSAVPFSVMEVLYVVLGLGLAAFLVLTAVRLVRRPGRLRVFLRRSGILAVAGLTLFSSYLWLWGIEYKTASFSAREDFRASGITVQDLSRTAERYIEAALSLADSVPRDEEGLFCGDMEEYFRSSVRVYDRLEKLFPSLAAPVERPKKMLLFSELTSRMGFTGVYFCFTGESNINVRQPAAFIPFTVAHELAHQKGVSSEQECNFLGIAAGITSDLPEYRYSCYLAGSLHLMNALAGADPDKWRELEGKITGPMRADLECNNRYWKEKRSGLTKASNRAYDAYLKANGQPLGMESYGACVDLLVEFDRRMGQEGTL